MIPRTAKAAVGRRILDAFTAAGAAEALERFSLISISVRGRPSSTPSRRTSSLNSSRSGSTRPSFMCSGRPPTLWWLLMTCALPVLLPADSITSG